MTKADKNGFYGIYGGAFVSETLMPALHDFEDMFNKLKDDKGFNDELNNLLTTFVGRPTPLYNAERFSKHIGVNVFLKREDLTHTGAHKINNSLGQVLMAKRAGKTRIIAETGAGQHGLSVATVAALFGLDAVIYMGAIDYERQMPNVKKMRLLGANVVKVESGTRLLKDAVNVAIQDWISSFQTSHYIIGSALGPHPYPTIVAHFQSVIGKETRRQLSEVKITPNAIIACVGGGSNSIGIFREFLDDKNIELYGVEAGGMSDKPGEHAIRMNGYGKDAIFQGMLSKVITDSNNNVANVHSISAGLDYPSVSPEHSYLYETGRVHYDSVTDNEAFGAFQTLCKLEGIIPALESSHAVAYAIKAKDKFYGKNVIINLSGRGDKDIDYLENMGRL